MGFLKRLFGRPKPPPASPSVHTGPVPAAVFACLLPGEIRILLHPGVGLADGGIPVNLPLAAVPFELRTPNTPLWAELDTERNVVRVWRREE